ncbi:sulfoacetaldehyde acetyltransferase [Rhodocyclus tenuis]|uniref:Sulfoacetaldehyde acetyltransferase n=1 Tax=Rhodocyclus gracilis TaxID=2929842 RepID=A0ABX0WJ51_9RHOO|nr:sulfoacetaldehyde acetyltransferase [Rhodocyclus gracilis]NJA88846.1 sulfoacetaldehyde acetyltransferase [Rhodocyclus gracilis]
MTEARRVYTGRQRVTPSEAFVETLVAQGVTDVFGIVGSAYMDAHDLFPLAGIRFISTAHEQNAAHMADGYARATGRHGVCIAQNGPGVTNFVTAIAAAYWAHSPVVAITPESGSLTAGLGGFQETEQLPIFSKITKWQTHVNSPSRIAELTGRAFHYALHERGPTQVNIPRDYFYGEIETEIPRPFPVQRGAGDSAAIKRAAKLLAAAKFPVIVAGGGVGSAGALAELTALAEHLTAPVVNSYLHNDTFPASHELAAGPLGYQGSQAAMKLIAQADVVLALGSRLGPFGTLPQYGLDYWPKNARIIQVDADFRVIGLVKPVEVGIHGDAKAAAAAIYGELRSVHGERPRNEARIAAIRAARAAWQQELDSLRGANEAGRVDPRRALAELAKARPKNAMVATDIGNVCSVSNSYLQFEEPNSFFAAMAFGNCGYAYPTAIGAKVGRPERPSIAYVGDGAWGMSLAEVLTCVRENIPAIAVVFDNGQWGAEKRNQIDYFDSRFLGTDLANPNFAEVAKAMGGHGITVEHEDQVGSALQEAIASNRPTVINLRLTQALGDPFRRDAFKPPRRLLDKYAAYSAGA